MPAVPGSTMVHSFPGHMLHGINEDIIHGFLENATTRRFTVSNHGDFTKAANTHFRRVYVSWHGIHGACGYDQRHDVRPFADPILDPAGTTIRGEMNAVRSVRQKSS